MGNCSFFVTAFKSHLLKRCQKASVCVKGLTITRNLIDQLHVQTTEFHLFEKERTNLTFYISEAENLMKRITEEIY